MISILLVVKVIASLLFCAVGNKKINNGVQYDDPMNKADLERAMNEDGVVMVSESIKIEIL